MRPGVSQPPASMPQVFLGSPKETPLLYYYGFCYNARIWGKKLEFI
jgi:hypothetical protein